MRRDEDEDFAEAALPAIGCFQLPFFFSNFLILAQGDCQSGSQEFSVGTRQTRRDQSAVAASAPAKRIVACF